MDASIHVQFSFVNRRTDPAQYARSFEIAPQGDDFDDIRAEYTGILQRQLTRGNNGIVKTKYLTFTIEADNLKAARARLERIETDLLGYFKMMGAAAHVLDGAERLEVLHGVFHPDGELFRFDWKTRCSYEQYNHGVYGMVAEHGKVVSRHYEPESEDALRGLLTAARQGRQKNRAATFKIKIGRKPSIRKQLAEAKSAAAPKKAPAKTKNQELEVG